MVYIYLYIYIYWTPLWEMPVMLIYGTSVASFYVSLYSVKILLLLLKMAYIMYNVTF